jgi:hypothetical protein
MNMKKLIALLLTAVMALSLLAVTASAEEEANWAYRVTIEGVGTIYYAKAYFAQENIVNPLTAAAYTADEIAAIVDGAAADNEAYTFLLPGNAFLGMGGFWYDQENTAAIVSHADPLTMDENGVFSTAEGEQVASPIVNWAFGVTIEGVGTIYYSREYFAKEGIVNPLTAAPYTAEEIATIVDGAVQGAEGYTFDVPAAALLGMNGFWYDAAGAAAITGHADPLAQSAEGVFTAADGTVVAGPIA